MLIGIDASRAITAAPTGTETYTRELVRALLACDRENSYRLYTRAPKTASLHSLFPGGADFIPGNVDVRAIPFPRLWTHVRLALEMLLHPPDLLFVPAHVLPPIRPRRSLVTIHDLGHLRFPEAYPPRQRLYHMWATQWNARQATRILADSEATRDDLVQFCKIQETKISVVYPAFDAQLYQPISDGTRIAETRGRYHLDQEYVIAVGTIQPRKNYARLIEAISKLEDETVQLVIVGKKGWLCQETFARVAELKMESRVQFLDYVPAADMPALISGARVFAFPSLHEGFGLPILEAQACGTPVVCSITSSLPEAAGDGALLLDPYDVEALTAAVARLIRDEALRSKLIANGLRNLARFSWEKSAAQVLRVFESL
jgi:glycosyltransferase involved in cell wall biosynthesis